MMEAMDPPSPPADDSEATRQAGESLSAAQDPSSTVPPMADEQEPTNRSAKSEPVASIDDTLIRYTPKSELRRPLKLLGEIGNDIWRGRELCWRLFNRNIRSLYRQTLLGLFWAFLPPLAQTAVWVFLNSSNVVRFDTGVNYVAYVLTGMILWQAFLDAFLAPLAAVNSGRGLLTKINFPRESLLIVAIAEVFFNLAIRSSLLVVVFLFFDIDLSWNLLLAPLGLVALVVVGTSFGLMTVPIGVLYHDVPRFLAIVTPFWMLLTPIVYPPPTTGPAQWFVLLNPVSPVLMLTRDLVLLGSVDHFLAAIVVIATSIPLLLVGLIAYRLSMPILIERMG